jgi:hypothetical protein
MDIKICYPSLDDLGQDLASLLVTGDTAFHGLFGLLEGGQSTWKSGGKGRWKFIELVDLPSVLIGDRDIFEGPGVGVLWMCYG